jgi:hypothetical protein
MKSFDTLSTETLVTADGCRKAVTGPYLVTTQRSLHRRLQVIQKVGDNTQDHSLTACSSSEHRHKSATSIASTSSSFHSTRPLYLSLRLLLS